jgi:hypothetical protein
VNKDRAGIEPPAPSGLGLTRRAQLAEAICHQLGDELEVSYEKDRIAMMVTHRAKRREELARQGVEFAAQHPSVTNHRLLCDAHGWPVYCPRGPRAHGA